MKPRKSFYPERQFHVLVNFNQKDERSLALLPGQRDRFLVVDQGKVLGELDYDRQRKCVSSYCKVDENILEQLSQGIRNYYS